MQVSRMARDMLLFQVESRGEMIGSLSTLRGNFDDKIAQ